MEIRIAATKLMVALFILLLGSVSQTMAHETRIKWFGHEAFSIITSNGKVLLIDHWLASPSNPKAKDGKDPLSVLAGVDHILLTHVHL